MERLLRRIFRRRLRRLVSEVSRRPLLMAMPVGAGVEVRMEEVPRLPRMVMARREPGETHETNGGGEHAGEKSPTQSLGGSLASTSRAGRRACHLFAYSFRGHRRMTFLALPRITNRARLFARWRDSDLFPCPTPPSLISSLKPKGSRWTGRGCGTVTIGAIL